MSRHSLTDDLYQHFSKAFCSVLQIETKFQWFPIKLHFPLIFSALKCKNQILFLWFLIQNLIMDSLQCSAVKPSNQKIWEFQLFVHLVKWFSKLIRAYANLCTWPQSSKLTHVLYFIPKVPRNSSESREKFILTSYLFTEFWFRRLLGVEL